MKIWPRSMQCIKDCGLIDDSEGNKENVDENPPFSSAIKKAGENMKLIAKRILALIMALALMMGFAAQGAFAESDDWKSLLRDAFGLLDEIMEDTDDYGYESDDYDEYEDYDFDEPITDPQQIVNYIDIYGCLPDNFITKNEAKKLGWDSSENYVGEVAPGMSIGGDRFGNYEGLLPDKKGRTWYECDANYKGKKRGAQRVVFSSDGLYYYTDDHYESFTQMFPED